MNIQQKIGHWYTLYNHKYLHASWNSRDIDGRIHVINLSVPFWSLWHWAVCIKASKCFQAKAPPFMIGMHCKPQAKAIAYTRMHNPLFVLTPVA